MKKKTALSPYATDLIWPTLRCAEIVGVGPFARSPIDPKKKFVRKRWLPKLTFFGAVLKTYEAVTALHGLCEIMLVAIVQHLEFNLPSFQ